MKVYLVIFIVKLFFFSKYLSFQPGVLEVLQLFGYFPNGKGDYVFIETKSNHELTQRTEAAWEFRRFYDELKKIKDDHPGVLEYCISV